MEIKRAQKALLDELGFRRQALHAANWGLFIPSAANALRLKPDAADMQELFRVGFTYSRRPPRPTWWAHGMPLQQGR
jgi:hypothetical protein